MAVSMQELEFSMQQERGVLPRSFSSEGEAGTALMRQTKEFEASARILVNRLKYSERAREQMTKECLRQRLELLSLRAWVVEKKNAFFGWIGITLSSLLVSICTMSILAGIVLGETLFNPFLSLFWLFGGVFLLLTSIVKTTRRS